MTLLALTGTSLLVLLLGVTLLVGFGANWLAGRFRIPDVLWLIGLGVLAGPLLGLLATGSLLLIAPVLGAATLVLILFDAGIDLQISEIRAYLGSALAFSAATYFLSAGVLFAAAYVVLFPGHFVLALLFATALGCASGTVIIPLARQLGLGVGLRNFVQLDGAFEDAIAVVVVTTILALRAPSSASLALSVTTSLVLPLPVGIAVGFAAGLIWLLFLYRWQGRPFSALATLGFLFVVYAVTEALGGSGILGALVFGIVLGNESLVRRHLRRTRPFRISEEMRKVEVEIAFVLRAYFLFLIGMFASLVNPGFEVGIVIIVLVVALLATRRAAFRGTTSPAKTPREWSGPVTALFGRGLTSAVLLIVSLELLPTVAPLFFPAILLIIGTNVAMTVWLFVWPVHRPVVEPVPERPWVDTASRFISLAEEPLTGADAPEADPAHEPPYSPPPLPRRREPPRTE